MRGPRLRIASVAAAAAAAAVTMPTVAESGQPAIEILTISAMEVESRVRGVARRRVRRREREDPQ